MSKYDPTDEQIDLIETDKSALIIAGPGTGKTRTAIEKSIKEVREYDTDSPHRMLFLSFSNAAVYRLMSSAEIVFSRKERRFLKFRTFHSCAADILKNYGRFVGLPCKIKIMDTLEEKFNAFEKGWMTSDEDYDDKLHSLAKTEGLLAFSVLIDFAIRLLSSCDTLRSMISRKFKLIIVDEFQDSSEEQWQLLKLIGQDSQVIAFGDPNQIIYSSMHSATKRRFEEFQEWKQIKKTPFSSTNFRCDDDEILKFANCLLNAEPYTKIDKSNVFLLEGFRNQLRMRLVWIWKKIHEQVGPNQTIGFLTPSGGIADEVAVTLRNPPPGAVMPIPVYATLAKDQAAHDALSLALVAFRDYSIQKDEESCNKAAMALLAMDLEWNTRKKFSLAKIKKTARVLEKCSETKNAKLYKLMVAIPNQINLNALVPAFIEALSEIDEFRITGKKMSSRGKIGLEQLTAIETQLSLFDELRSNRLPKGLDGYDAGKGKTHVLSYYKAKGREFDFVVIIVDPTRGESNKVSLDEKRRLYYVCATRAKEWLGVFYYKNQLGPVLGPALAPVRPVNQTA